MKIKVLPVFFRKGEIGNYKNEMDQETLSHFIKENSKELKYFDYI